MKINARKRIIIGLVILLAGILGFSVLGFSGVSLQSPTSVMRVIGSTSFFSTLTGILGGQILISGLRAWRQERKAKKMKKEDAPAEPVEQ